ncbi:MAG: hypothetical protein ACM3S4_02085 [Burkholderiales bacterium]
MVRRFACLLAAALIILTFGGTALADNRPSLATPDQTSAATVLTVIVTALFIAVCVLLAVRKKETGENFWPLFLIAAAAAVALRVFIAAVYPGYAIDMGCFRAWSLAVYEYGPSGFYSSLEFADYPPGYMYVLWVVGFIRSIFGISDSSAAFAVLLKLPAIISEVILAAFVYRIASHEAGKKFALLCSMLLLFNPAMFFNSSVWGQMDAFFTLFVVLTLYHLKKERYLAGAFFFAVSLLIKPQALMFLPVVGLAYFYALFKKGGFGKAVAGIVGGLAIIASVIFLGSLPFQGNQPTFWIINRYASTVGSYPYATLNAFNLFALSGGNWVEVTETFLVFDYKTWGMIFLVAICAAIVFLQWRTRDSRPYFDLAAFLVISVFMLMHMVHERYIAPACVLLVFAYVYSRDTTTLVFAGAYSVSALINQLVTLYADTTAAPETPLLIFSAVNLALYLVYAVITIRKLSSGKVLIKSPALLG